MEADHHARPPRERNAAHVIVGIARSARFKWSAPRQVFLDWPLIQQTQKTREGTVDLSHILLRTERGTQELQTRSGHVTHRQRAILLLAGGERTAAEILAQLSGAGPDTDDLARLLAEGYVASRAPVNDAPKPKMPPKPAPATQTAARHMRQASIADWRLGQAGAFSALQRYMAEGPEAPIDFLSGLAAPLYAALATCRSEASAHAVAAFLEARLHDGHTEM
ncbi:hypothetical protein [Ralstonia mannitolilytica]|uniref:hypothetical protein n=1 Tax=Ralstonia mannitolilytica TaxID=105219 RepID=UPI0029313912|nr:hypothetical protein [Ralstonia mannitolilytica]